MEEFIKILFVAAGGALGAVARHLINISPVSRLSENFPFPTFIINVTGSFLIGFLLILFTDRIQVSDNFRMAVIVGFLGAFTTFSTFEMELYGLVRDRSFLIALVYMLGSLLIGFAGLAAGVALGRKV